MRDDIVINTTVRKQGNSWCLPITLRDKQILGISQGDDLEVLVLVRERKPNHAKDEE